MKKLMTLCFLLSLMLVLAAFGHASADSGIVISEIMASNGTWSGGHAYDWIELHNTEK